MAQTVKNLPVMQETRVRSLGWEDPRRRKWQLTSLFLFGESHGQRSLAGSSPSGHKGSGMTEQLSMRTQILSYIHICFILALSTCIRQFSVFELNRKCSPGSCMECVRAHTHTHTHTHTHSLGRSQPFYSVGITAGLDDPSPSIVENRKQERAIKWHHP